MSYAMPHLLHPKVIISMLEDHRRRREKRKVRREESLRKTIAELARRRMRDQRI